MGIVGGLILLDETVVGVALPSMQADLGMSQTATHWVVNSYMLVFTGFAAAAGRFGDILTLRTVFISGTVLFGLASAVSGLAPDGNWLLAARAVQGLGAAAIFPLSMAMVSVVFPKEERGKAIGTVAAIGTAFLMAGPLVGGFLTELISWRWIFFINVPIAALIVFAVLAVWQEKDKGPVEQEIDYSGLVSLVAGLGLLVFAVMQGPLLGWSNVYILVALLCSVAVLWFFVRLESRRPEPLIDVALFSDATVSAAAAIMMIGQFSKIVIVIFGALYLQHVLNMSPLTAGLGLLAGVAGTPLLAAKAGQAADRYGARGPAICGLAVSTIGMIWVGLATFENSYALLFPGLLIWGGGLPFCAVPTMRVIVNAVPADKQGQVGGVMMTVRLLGGTLGMALGAALLAETGHYAMVFLTTGVLMLAIFVTGWFAIERPSH